MSSGAWSRRAPRTTQEAAHVLSRQLPLPSTTVRGALAAAGIDGDRRPQTLSVESGWPFGWPSGRFGGDRPMTTVGVSGARIHVVRFAPAKLNLTLAVVGQRSDGYHALHRSLVPLSLGDALTVSAAPAGASHDSLRITGATIAPAPDNLVLRAIAAARVAVAATWHDAPPNLRRWPRVWPRGSPSPPASAAAAATRRQR